MDHIYFRITQFYKKTIHGMAAVPALITLVLFALAVWIIAMEFQGLWDGFLSTFTFLRVSSPETARAITGAIVAGMISLTVFSFSMVMVVVNQASSNYSPKITEGFINNRTNKFTLGIFVGTIVVALTTLFQIGNARDRVPDLAILLSIVLTLLSIALFVNFINNISNSVKITNLVEDLFLQTKSVIESDSKELRERAIETEGWPVYEAGHSGYFQNVNERRLLHILKENDLILKVIPVTGDYIMEKAPLFQLNRHPGEHEVLEKIRETFITYSGEHISENEFYGFRQLREIAVKGLSPGINDPGIAKLCIDYLGELLAMWMSYEKKVLRLDDDGLPRFIVAKHDVKNLLETCFTPIKSYGNKDFTIVTDLLQMLWQLSFYDGVGRLKEVLNMHASSVIDDADRELKSPLDRNLVNEKIAVLNGGRYFNLKYLHSGKQA